MKNAAIKVKAMGLFVLNGRPWSPQALTRSAGSPIPSCWAAGSKHEIAFIRRALSGGAERPRAALSAHGLHTLAAAGRPL